MFARYFSSLWRHRDFMRFWSGQTVSMFGSQITVLALPLTAVLLLDATAVQMGIMQALGTIPFLIIGLFAGVYVDRFRRRPLLIGANIGSALILGSVPLVAALGGLTIEYLYAVEFLAACMMLLFELAYLSYVPSLIPREDLADGNSKLEGSRAVSQVAGPSLGGLLIQWFTAPFAILIDAVTYLIATFFLLRIRTAEPEPQLPERRNIWAQIGEGLKVVVQHPLLRPIVGCTATLNFFGSAYGAVYLLFVVDQLGLSPSWLGIVLGVGSVGALLGAGVSAYVSKRLGLGPSIMAAAALSGLGVLLVPFATPVLWLAVPLLILGQALSGLGSTVYFVNQVSLRQAITPHHLLGRVNASMRFISRGAAPIGALLGGGLGTLIGLRATVALMALGTLLCVLWLLFSPVRTLKTLPEE